MTIEVVGAGGRHAQRIISWCEQALAHIGGGHAPDIRVSVRGIGALDAPGSVAGASDDGSLWLHRQLLTDADRRLGFILYEEVAHVVLAQAGVPNDNRDTTEAFWQECFATYVQTDAVLSGRIPGAGKLTTYPVKAGSPLSNLGKQVGATVAGSIANRQHIEDWKASGQAPPRKVRLVERGLSLVPPITVEMVVDAYRSGVR